MIETPAETADLLAFVEASPTPWHCAAEARERLSDSGFVAVQEGDASWPDAPGTCAFVVRGDAAVAAWRLGRRPPCEAGFRVACAHTDSPSLRVKPRPDRHKAGTATLGVEPYGGGIWATWTDRDLSLAGRVSLRAPGSPFGVESRLVRWERPLCSIPNVAIHLNRQVDEDGLKLNKQSQLPAVWALSAEPLEDGLRGWLARELGTDAAAILAWDLCLYDVQPPAVGGRDGELIHASRLDNLASCHALLAALADAEQTDATSLVVLFDHEEIGSRTSRGASGHFLRDIVRRLGAGPGLDLSRAAARSFLVSVDMAHGVHPNYADQHDPEHQPRLGAGPVLKTHSEWRYAGDSESAAIFRAICADAGVPLQDFVSRSDLRCGSTVGPMVASDLGMRGVDVGNPIWAMHSIRETGGTLDQPAMIRALGRFLLW